MKPWQAGYELAYLREMAEPFKRHLKPLSLGAFGVPNERDVAAALKAGELTWTGRPPAAAALIKVLRSPSTHADFAGNRLRLAAGSLLMRALAGPPGPLAKLVDGAKAAAAGRTVWVESWEELPGLRELLEGRGFVWVSSKIAASSEVKGLYRLGAGQGLALAPADAVALGCLGRQWLAPGELAAVRAELAAYGNRWQQHYSSYNKRQSWTAFALKGYGNAAFIEKPAEMSKAWKAANAPRLKAPCALTEAAAAFPQTLALLARLPTPGLQRVRFMRLAPGGGELTRHADITDPEAGTGEGCVMRLHIPLVTSPACQFKAWSLRGQAGTAHFPEAALCYLDTRKPHAVRNDSAVDRIHLVVDCFASASLRELAAAGRLL